MADKKIIGTNPEPNTPENDEKVKAEREAQEAREQRIANYSSVHNSQAVDKVSMKKQLEYSYSVVKDIDGALASEKAYLQSSGKLDENGKKNKLSGLDMDLSRNKISNLKESKKSVMKDISRLKNELSGSLNKDTNRIKKANLRKSAKKDSYQKQHGSSIEAAIDKTVDGFSDEKVATLKAEVAKADTKEGNALMMKALVNVPRFLHTRVVSNPEARERYMQHFRSKLGEKRKKSELN